MTFMYRQRDPMAEPAQDAILWRYMSFTKFASLLTKRALFFARADKLGDPFEGSIPQLTIQAIHDDTTLGEHKNTLILMLRNRPRYPLINCWHENETESDAMWKLYAGHGEGIAIRTTYRSLRESLIGKELVSVEKVEYVDYDTTHVQLSDPLAQFMKKRRSFAHEREVRAVIEHLYFRDNQIIVDGPDTCDVGIYHDIDLDKLVQDIFLPPNAEGWFTELVQTTTANFGLQSPVNRSSLSSPPLWP